MGLLMRMAIAALFLAGCFSPDAKDGVVACALDGSCPPDFVCNTPDNLCYRTLPPPGHPDASTVGDAAVGDATVYDAPPPDATPLPQCSDGQDNDCDGRIDFGVDPGCDSGEDDDEHGNAECDDGIDNDGDNNIDFQIASPECTLPKDDGCTSSFDDRED